MGAGRSSRIRARPSSSPIPRSSQLGARVTSPALVGEPQLTPAPLWAPWQSAVARPLLAGDGVSREHRGEARAAASPHGSAHHFAGFQGP